MAIVKQCDRCGKFYNPYPMSNNPNMYNALRRVQMTDSNMVELITSSPIDLCLDCICEFDKFMDMSDIKMIPESASLEVSDLHERYTKKIDPSSTEDL